MKRIATHIAASLLAFGASETLLAQDEADEAPPYAFEREPESDPDLIGAPNLFGSVIDAAIAEGGSAWIPRVKTWSPGSVLRVCFYSDANDLNAYVAQNAVAWNHVGANVRFNFGSLSSPRQCAPGIDAAIRVAYNSQGANFSRYGVDSLVSANFWNYPSMHLDVSTLQSPYARGTILHEFGHALGMFHEHQKPIEDGCENEFDWPRVYQSSLRYQGWDQRRVDSQFRPVFDFYDVALNDGIDRSSVMLYAMTPAEFLSGSASHCYINSPNNEISSMDAAVLRAAYTDGAWEGNLARLQGAVTDARERGDTSVARGLAVYMLETGALNQFADAYETEQALGFNPAPGEDAVSQLNAALDALVNPAE